MSSSESLRSVRVTIDRAALRFNLRRARTLAGSRVFATIKADAYGHGAIEVMHALSRGDCAAEERADGFAVVTLGEAVNLREAGARAPILVLQGPQRPDDCGEFARFSLWPVIHDLAQFDWYRQTDTSRVLPAWLKVDTGMGRLGVPVQAVNRLLGDGSVRWCGVMSHLACADEPGNAHTREQIRCFDTLPVPEALELSLANSAAVISWPESRKDWARPGLMLYGASPLSGTSADAAGLRPVMQVSTPLISIKELPSGASVGYGQSWRCPERMRIGHAAIGYGDGLPRVLDESAAVIVSGCPCPVVGRVSMDSIAIDLRTVPAARLGEPVVLWGPERSVEYLSAAAGTINYELLTTIRGRREWIN